VCFSWCFYSMTCRDCFHDTSGSDFLLRCQFFDDPAKLLSAQFHLKTPPSDGGHVASTSRNTTLVAPRRWKEWNHRSFPLSTIVPISRYSLWNGRLAVTCVFGSTADAHSQSHSEAPSLPHLYAFGVGVAAAYTYCHGVPEWHYLSTIY
jgi:hypothetical protein